MSKRSIEKYGSVSGLKEKDIEDTHRFLHDTSIAELESWTDARTETHYVGPLATPYKMIVDHREKDEAVVVTGEFANGITPHIIARARVVRDMVSPDASLLLQPNAATGQLDNMNFRPSERAAIRQGLLLPFSKRFDRSLEQLGDPDQLTFYGPSQGGTVALEYAAERGGSIAVASLEAPNIIERSRRQMAQDFIGCGGLLKEIIQENYGDNMAHAPVLSLMGLAKYAAGIVHPDNRAIIDLLRSGTAPDAIEKILSAQGSVVHAYAEGDKVSPVERNDDIAREFAAQKRYQSVRLEGDHSITNNFALSAALARTARTLLQTVV